MGRLKLLISGVLLAAVTFAVACKAKEAPPAGTEFSTQPVRGAFDIDQVALKIVDIPLVTDTGVASAKVAAFTPGFPFTISGVSTFTRTKSGTLAGKVKIGGKVVVSTLTWGVDSLKNMTLLGDSVQGTANDTVYVTMATTAGGTLNQGHITFKLKPRF
jgi:hypothetical protein